MKTVKSLLLGSAAGVAVVTGAQAADLPVKARPVEYVRICSVYGAGFFYIPGTDICIKVGGYVRAQAYWNAGTSPTIGPFIGASGQFTRLQNAPNELVGRARAIVTFDTRQQTEWGTLRTYTMLGLTQDWPGVQPGAPFESLYAKRAFIQFAGFTLGKAQSYFEIFPQASFSYFPLHGPDIGDLGQLLAAYTYQFGNGISATLSLEDPRRIGAVNVGGAAASFTNPWTVGATVVNNTKDVEWPDVVANIRVDQAWGSLQVMGAIHDSSGAYFTNCSGGTLTGALPCGRPDDKVGFAVGAGAVLRMDPISPGDRFATQFVYSKGAVRYAVMIQPGAGNPNFFGPAVLPGAVGQLGLGFWTDGVFANPTTPGSTGSVELTTAWNVLAAYEHLWTPALRTSIYGSYTRIEYNNTASNLICASLGVIPAAGTGRVDSVGGTLNCDPDFAVWQIGARTQYNFTPAFYVGLDVMYQRLDTAFDGSRLFFTAATGLPRPSGFYDIRDQDKWSVTIRAHRDFLP